MQSQEKTTTYVIGRTDGLVVQLRSLISWIERDAAERSARARVIFLGGIVHGGKTKLIMDEVYRVMERFPGSAVVKTHREENFLDFLEGDWNPSPTRWWMTHGGRDIVESFGVSPDMRRSADIRRFLKKTSPPLLDVLKSAKDYDTEGDYCFIRGSDWPNSDLTGSDFFFDNLGGGAINAWSKVMKKIIVYSWRPSNDCYPEVDDDTISLGGFPSQTGRVDVLAIDEGRATRFAIASGDVRGGVVSIYLKPVELFRKGPLGAVRFAEAI
ncbi:hypothetical protein ASE04_29010 [Rhizobium sp. Root708]|uniref:hypothetical protein n=1 Tax=Rhizobium sp. Root708 TaxID=1736592 RepID=UPI0006FBAE1C|nr:hypothetical protein [Rhizobium sp. Root708]KRB56193.1 hypothetical protein ASE04_29010 [Rhizobium sp. Root708]